MKRIILSPLYELFLLDLHYLCLCKKWQNDFYVYSVFSFQTSIYMTLHYIYKYTHYIYILYIYIYIYAHIYMCSLDFITFDSLDNHTSKFCNFKYIVTSWKANMVFPVWYLIIHSFVIGTQYIFVVFLSLNKIPISDSQSKMALLINGHLATFGEISVSHN